MTVSPSTPLVPQRDRAWWRSGGSKLHCEKTPYPLKIQNNQSNKQNPASQTEAVFPVKQGGEYQRRRLHGLEHHALGPCWCLEGVKGMLAGPVPLTLVGELSFVLSSGG